MTFLNSWQSLTPHAKCTPGTVGAQAAGLILAGAYLALLIYLLDDILTH